MHTHGQYKHWILYECCLVDKLTRKAIAMHLNPAIPHPSPYVCVGGGGYWCIKTDRTVSQYNRKNKTLKNGVALFPTVNQNHLPTPLIIHFVVDNQFTI